MNHHQNPPLPPMEDDEQPRAELLAMLAAPLYPVEASPPQNLAIPTTPDELAQFAADAITTHSLGQGLKRAREETGATMQEVGDAMSVTRGRVAQVEGLGLEVRMGTFVRQAEAMGYQVDVTLRPTSRSRGRRAIVVPLATIPASVGTDPRRPRAAGGQRKAAKR